MAEIIKEERSESELWADGFTDTLRDWQWIDGEAGADPTPWPVKIDKGAGSKIQVDVIAPDKTIRTVWIEVADGNLVVHCYDAAHDEPLNVRIGPDGITLDDDRKQEGIRYGR